MKEVYIDTALDGVYLRNYIHTLVNRFFKILPIREENGEGLSAYMESLKRELIGCKSLTLSLRGDAAFISLLATLQYLIDNQDSSVRIFKREVFRCISICNYLSAKFGGEKI